MYLKCGKHARGKENFKWMNRDVNSWNLMIGADGEISGWALEAYGLFPEMKRRASDHMQSLF